MSVHGQLKETQGFTWILDDRDTIQDRLLTEGIHEWAETTLLPDFVSEGDIVLDIGANIGYYTLLFSNWVGAKGYVHAFEPFPVSYERLEWHVKINALENVSTYQLAVGDKAECNFYNSVIGNSNENLGGYSILNNEAPRKGEGVEIRTIRVDDFVKEHKLSNLDFLKIDVEGYEPLVLDGAKETIRKFKPNIMLEVLGLSCERYGITPQELLDPLIEAGYHIYFIQKRPKLELVPFAPEHLQPPVHFNAICLPAKRSLNVIKTLKRIIF